MSCCGQQRSNVAESFSEMKKQPLSTHVFFQYIGQTALTALGTATGNRYRFDSPGAIVAVDYRDQSSMRGIPHLRQVNRT